MEPNRSNKLWRNKPKAKTDKYNAKANLKQQLAAILCSKEPINSKYDQAKSLAALFMKSDTRWNYQLNEMNKQY